MKIGMMNHPGRELAPQLEFAAQEGFDFIDFTLEPPRSWRDRVDASELRRQLRRLGLEAVGHTSWYLPLGMPFPLIQEATAHEVIRCMEFFHEAEIDRFALHFWLQVSQRMFEPELLRDYFLATLEPVDRAAERLGVTPMLENTPLNPPLFQVLQELLAALPHFAFHLDVGHVNLGDPEITLARILDRLGARLRHVHFSDNLGDKDLHLPLGCGTIDWPETIRLLQALGYDDTLTLEVFSSSPEYLLLSRELLQRWWRQTRAR
jgi:sugar phosphate isomerase/epimerase